MKFMWLVAHAAFSRARRNNLIVDGSTDFCFVLGKKRAKLLYQPEQLSILSGMLFQTGCEMQAHEEKIKGYCSEEMAGSVKRREKLQHARYSRMIPGLQRRCHKAPVH